MIVAAEPGLAAGHISPDHEQRRGPFSTQNRGPVSVKIVSNCTTQFLGKQNSPTDQQSVKSMDSASGGAADDIGRLTTGEFYFKSDKSGKPFKVRTPNCLSYHPSNPPTPEEVIAKARPFAAFGASISGLVGESARN